MTVTRLFIKTVKFFYSTDVEKYCFLLVTKDPENLST